MQFWQNGIVLHVVKKPTRYFCLAIHLMFYMEHSPAWEANRLSAGQENLRILQYQKFQHCMHTCPSPVPILGQLDPVHAHISRFLKIQLNIILPSTPGTSKRSRSIRFPHQNPVYVILSPKRVTCPANLIFLHLITQKILVEEQITSIM